MMRARSRCSTRGRMTPLKNMPLVRNAYNSGVPMRPAPASHAIQRRRERRSDGSTEWNGLPVLMRVSTGAERSMGRGGRPAVRRLRCRGTCGILRAMKISVVVPAFNEEKLIADTLRSIRLASEAFAARGWEWEMVVCDNDSTDRTAELARAGGARVVHEPMRQIARSRNAGAAVATGDWLVFVDADSQPSPGLFGAVAEVIVGGRHLGGGSTVTMDDTRLWFRIGLAFWNGISRTCRWMAGSFIFCERRVFQEMGGFNEALYAAEEIEFSRRLKSRARREGKKLVILRRHPLLTSSRKVHLYTPWEIARFMLRTVLSGGRTLGTRQQCEIWYDGRR
ncbi:MAG: glycosyltransferase [Pedosphaera sp.]|nr:glycosyltransferase [Pedosphaera sp.]